MAEKCIKGICKGCSDLHINSGKSVVQIPKMLQYYVFNFRCKCILFVGIHIKYSTRNDIFFGKQLPPHLAIQFRIDLHKKII